MEGWIKVYRKISAKAYYSKDSEKVHLWVHLLIKANHSEYEEMLGGNPIVCKPGQFTTGRKQLSKETGISESKIERILTYFEKIEQQIEQQKTNTNRLISIINWKDYQQTEQQIEQRPNNDRTTTEQQLNNDRTHSKNDKNKKNDKNDKNNKDVFDFSFLEIEYKEPFEKWINYKKSKKQMYKTQESLEDCYNNLIALSERNPQMAMQIVCQSTGNNWSGLFGLKTTQKNKSDGTKNYLAGRISEIIGNNQ